MSLNDTPCVSCGRCAETCPTGALMPKPRVLAEVRGRREPLHPVRHLRGRVSRTTRSATAPTSSSLRHAARSR
jgi:formate hydrogenlyase subunit 6/NADH:ubiquinone oxidoreductase subunit I